VNLGGQIARFPWEGRQAVAVGGKTFSVTAGPHAETSRVSYTVPANKTALLLAASGSVFRASSPTTYGAIHVKVRVDRGGAVYDYPFVVGVQGSTLLFTNSRSVGLLVPLFTADVLDMVTSDASTGGTVDFWGSVSIIEFDTLGA